jgi:gamma-glutamyltranspeptidase
VTKGGTEPPWLQICERSGLDVHERGRLSIEGRISTRVQQELANRGHKIVPWPDFEVDATGVGMVVDLSASLESGRVLAGAADPRRSGYVVGR